MGSRDRTYKGGESILYNLILLCIFIDLDYECSYIDKLPFPFIDYILAISNIGIVCKRPRLNDSNDHTREWDLLLLYYSI